MKEKCIYILTLVAMIAVLTSCDEEEYAVPVLKQELQNDVIKRTLGPNLVGLDIEFAYAMAIPPSMGKIVSAQVEASIPGAEHTYLENKSYYTNGSGDDIGIEVGSKAVTSGGTTSVSFIRDTAAATLRYFYHIPSAARGKEVSFKFSAQASNGQSVSYSMGPYKIAQMDMVLDLNVTDSSKAYISIEDLAVYDAATATEKAGKIDLIYLYRSIANISFGHALVSPAAKTYLPGVMLPAGADRRTKTQKVWNLRDFHLARLQYGIFVDDPDFQKLDISSAPDYAVNLKAEAGVWVETQDGRYRAYVYINSVDNGKKSARISIKRYTIK